MKAICKRNCVANHFKLKSNCTESSNTFVFQYLQYLPYKSRIILTAIKRLGGNISVKELLVLIYKSS